MSENRVLLLSWEYPPVIEGGLARHVCKLAEALVRQGVAVDVLTRGAAGPALQAAGSSVDGAGRALQAAGSGTQASEQRGGVNVHRVREPSWPRDLDRFVAWVEHMNEDMLAAGVALAEQHDYDLVHGHDWLVAQRLRHARRAAGRGVCDDDPRHRARAPPGLGAGRAAGAHPLRRALDGPARGLGDRLLLLHARACGGHLRHRRAAGSR